MNNNTLAAMIYEYLKDSDHIDNFGGLTLEERITEIEGYLSDPHTVSETIENIEEISDACYDHGAYVTEVKPLLRSLREVQKKLEAEQGRRFVGETRYEVKHALKVGDKEIVFAEDKNAENGMRWFVGDYTSNDILGQYVDCQVSDDYLEAIHEFSVRVNTQIKKMIAEIGKNDLQHEVFTAEHCYHNDRGQSIEGKIVAIKADIFRPEYRRGDVQLVLVSGGNGARANSRGNAVFCYRLNDGKHTRFERYDVQGEVTPEHLPQWAKDKAAEIMAEKAEPSQEKSKHREER